MSDSDDSDSDSVCSGSTTPDDDALADHLEDAKYSLGPDMYGLLRAYRICVFSCIFMCICNQCLCVFVYVNLYNILLAELYQGIHQHVYTAYCLRVRTHTQSYDEVVYEDPQGGQSSVNE